MFRNLHWSTRQEKFFWFSFSFLFAMITLPLLTQTFSKETSSAWMLPLTGKFIVIDPGHGGPDGGAVSNQGLLEKDVALKIALYLRDYLQEAGAFVIMTREKDVDLANPETKKLSRRKAEDLMKRIHLTKEKKADALVSIHLNAIPFCDCSGAQTFYNPVREENKKLATWIQTELIRQLENTHRLAKQKGDIYILKASPVPTALVEVGFLSHSQEASLLASEHYQKKIAASIYQGMLHFYSGKEPPAQP